MSSEPSPEQLKFMKRALKLAQIAAERGEVPVGAVIAREGEVIAEASNHRERLQSPLGHAELIAIQKASQRLGSWRLSGCDLYVTLEPCPMCAGAIVQARLKRVIFGTRDPKAGAARSLYQLADDPRLNHRAEIIEGVNAEEASQLLKRFFKNLRA